MSRVEHQLLVGSEKPPMVEFDPAAGAVYVRFSQRRVAKTVERSSEKLVVTVDLDRDGNVVGIEGIGLTEFSLVHLLKTANVSAPRTDLARATLRATPRHAKDPAYA